jgi:hypothetical protein
MEDCKICYTKESNKKLPCSHTLCSDCCVRLNSAICPFCRQNFIYSADEIKQRIKLGIINGYKLDVPPGLAFRPSDWLNTDRQLVFSFIDNDENHNVNPPLSRTTINGERRRRRFLSIDEVLERRKEIKERKARHWTRKNERLNKLTSWWEC